MVSTDTIRRIQINTTTSGIDQATAGLGRLKGAEDGVVISSDKLTRSQLSVATQLDALQRRYDLAYRGAGELAKGRADARRCPARRASSRPSVRLRS